MRVSVSYWSNLYFFYMYRNVSHQQTFILMSQRREQDEAIGVACVCMSGAFSVRVHQCGQLYVYVYIYAYVFCIRVSLCVPIGTICSGSLLVGPGSVEL